MDLSSLDVSNSFATRVLSNRRCGPVESAVEIRQLTLAIDARPPALEAGHSLAFLTPNCHRPHLRLYSVAGLRRRQRGLEIDLFVRRCFAHGDDGESIPGRASNYLCDCRPGDRLRWLGPCGAPFRIPDCIDDHVVMIGAGTGVAPFRAFIQRLAAYRNGWRGQVHLFYGADSGLEQAYGNDRNADAGDYVRAATFHAYQVVRPSIQAGAAESLGRVVADHRELVWRLMRETGTHVYVAGQRRVGQVLESELAGIAESVVNWHARRNRMMAEGRWQEILYD